MLVKDNLTRKERIELKATELFREKGYAATSMRDLAAKLGMEAGSIYSHVRSKEEILQKICFRMANEFSEKLTEVENSNLSPIGKLKRIIIEHTKVITKDISASAVFWNEWKHLSKPFIDDFQLMKNTYEEKFIDIIDQSVKSKDFKKTDNKFTAMLILSALNGIHQWYKPEGPMNPEEVGEQLAELLIGGIKKKLKHNNSKHYNTKTL